MSIQRWLAAGLALTLNFAASAAPSTSAERWTAWERHQQLQASTPLAGLSWRAIGPIVQGGRIVDIEVVPGEPYSFYVAYASGGVWKTTNNGVTFSPLSDQLATMISGDLAIDPNHPQRLWVGSGEANASRSSYAGLGLFRSDDGGASFRPAGLDDADRIARIIVDPDNGDRVYVAVQGRLYTPGGARGVYRTVDGGDSWEQVLAGANEWTGATDLSFDPSNSQVIYASLWDKARRPWDFRDSGPGSGIYKSSDGGDSWTRLSNGFPSGNHVGRIGLAVAPSQPQTVYAVLDNQQTVPAELADRGEHPLAPLRLRDMSKDEFLRQDTDLVDGFLRGTDLPLDIDAKKLMQMLRSGELSMQQLRDKLSDGNSALFDAAPRGIEVYRSDDGGQRWAKTHEAVLGEFYYTFGYYFGQIRVAPDDPDRIYLLGVPMMSSADGGKNFVGINQPDVHVDHHAWWIDPQAPQRIYSGNDGGLDVSYDGGESWLKLDRQAVGQSYAVAVDMAEPYNVYTGLQDNGTLRGSSKADPDDIDAWSMINGGDGMQIQIDPRDPKIFYSGYQFGFYSRQGSSNDGQVRPRPGLFDPALRFNWQTPIALSSHNPDILYMGANRLYRSMDQGVSWSAISPDLSRSEQRGDVPFATITSISESSIQFGLIWAGTDDGQIHVSVDGGVSWSSRSKGLPSELWVSRVVASSAERERVYLALNGYRNDDQRAYLYRSEDLGRRWTSIAAGLPAEPINVVREDPVNPEVLYVGTDRGVYASIDRGDSWLALGEGLPNVPVHDLVVHPRDRELVAGTHGRSVWVLDVLPLQDLSATVRDADLHLFHVDAVQASERWRSGQRRWFEDPDALPQLDFHLWSAQAGDGRLQVLDAQQRVIAERELNLRQGINGVRWDLLLDADAALAAEAGKVEASDAAEGESRPWSETPVAQAVALGQPLYVFPGDYTLRVINERGSADQTLKVKPPRKPEPRLKPAFKLRGRED